MVIDITNNRRSNSNAGTQGFSTLRKLKKNQLVRIATITSYFADTDESSSESNESADSEEKELKPKKASKGEYFGFI